MKLILQVECTFLFTLFFFSRHYESALKLSKISIKDKWFVDENDRVVTFRGINAVKKSYPWIPNEPSNDLTNPKHINNLKQWGFNVVRLGFMWSGLMPKKNFINSTYLNEMVDIVNNLADVGIYTIIDLHQDMFSSKFGSYDGVPLWILNEMPNSKFDFPWPLKNSTLNVSLFAAYATESCSFAFQCLYDNTNNFTDYFELYWSIIAKTFSNTTSVLGYELLNEPWAGDIFANPLLLLPGFAGKFNLMKLYDRTYETIRRYDADTLVFYEPVTWGVLFNMNILGTGFTRPPCNDYKKTVLSWHYYCWMLEFKENPLVNDTYPLFIRIMCDKVQLKASFEAIKLDHMILGSPTFLTEFGVCAFGLNNSQGLNTEECEHVLDAAERYLQSWTYWDSTFYYNHTMDIILDLVNVFSRVYPKSTNGIPINLSFNTTTKDFVYTFDVEIGSNDNPTEIFIPYHTYPFGFEVIVSDHLKWSFHKEDSLLLVYSAFSKKDLYKYSNDSLVESTVKVYSLVNFV